MTICPIKKFCLMTAAGLSLTLSYSPSAESQYLMKKNDGTLVVGFDNIVNRELGRELAENLGPEIFYLEDRCYLPAAGIEKMLEDGPAKVYAALDLVEKRERSRERAQLLLESFSELLNQYRRIPKGYREYVILKDIGKKIFEGEKTAKISQELLENYGPKAFYYDGRCYPPEEGVKALMQDEAGKKIILGYLDSIKEKADKKYSQKLRELNGFLTRDMKISSGPFFFRNDPKSNETEFQMTPDELISKNLNEITRIEEKIAITKQRIQMAEIKLSITKQRIQMAEIKLSISNLPPPETMGWRKGTINRDGREIETTDPFERQIRERDLIKSIRSGGRGSLPGGMIVL